MNNNNADNPDYQYHSAKNHDGVIIEVVDDNRFSLCTQYDGHAVTALLPIEEIDKMINGLQSVKNKLLGDMATIPSRR